MSCVLKEIDGELMIVFRGPLNRYPPRQKPKQQRWKQVPIEWKAPIKEAKRQKRITDYI